MKTALRIAAVLALLSAVAGAQDWVRFRGPNGTGVSAATGLPSEFGPAKNLLWKAAVPFGRSSPVVAGDRIFLTATAGEQLITLALDRTSGRMLWRREVKRAHANAIYKANDGASPSPATDGKNVYVFFPDLGLISYDAAGKERWRLPLGPFDTFYGMSSSTILSGDTVLQVCDARARPFIVAVDAKSGKVRWRRERTSDVRYEAYASPVLYEPKGGPPQLVVLGANRVDAFAVTTGAPVWWVKGLAFYPVASPVISDDVLVASTYGSDAPEGPTFDDFLSHDSNKDGVLSREEFKRAGELYDHFPGLDTNHDGLMTRAEWDFFRNAGVGGYGMVAVKLGGRGDISSAEIWREKKMYPVMPTPLFYNGVLYVVRTGGIVVSFNPRTGETYKAGRSEKALGEYSSSPVGVDGKVVMISEAGMLTVLKAQPQWEVLGVSDLGEECYATPAFAGGAMLVRTREALYSFGKK
jgi:outer membrane protein assembly factor BamB